MADLRESIIARLVVVLGTVAGVTTVGRNVTNISDARLPAIIVFDANEEAEDGEFDRRPPGRLRRISLKPQIILLVQDDSADLGTTLNALRAAVIKAILADDTLIDLTHDNVGIRYEGCSSGLARGRQMEGQMVLNFSFNYILNPNSL